MTVMKASDLLKAANTHANRPAANAVPTGALYSCTDHNLIYRSDGSSWSTWATLGGGGGGGSGQGFIDFARAKRTSGNLTINSTTLTNVDTGLDLVLSASAGDIIECQLAARASGGSYCVFDFATIVSGSPVNSISTESAAATSVSVSHPDWGRSTLNETSSGAHFSGTKMYTLQSGDISSGTVTLRLRCLTGASTTVYASDPSLYVAAKNLGPAL